MTLQVGHSTSQRQRTQMSEHATRLVSRTHERLVLALSRSWQARLSNWAHVAQCGSPPQADRASRQEQALITTLQPGLPPQCTCPLFFGIPRKLHIQSSSTRGLHFSIVLVFCDGHPPFWATLPHCLCWVLPMRYVGRTKVQEADFLWPLSRALCFQTLAFLGPEPRWQAAVNQKQATDVAIRMVVDDVAVGRRDDILSSRRHHWFCSVKYWVWLKLFLWLRFWIYNF